MFLDRCYECLDLRITYTHPYLLRQGQDLTGPIVIDLEALNGGSSIRNLSIKVVMVRIVGDEHHGGGQGRRLWLCLEPSKRVDADRSPIMWSARNIGIGVHVQIDEDQTVMRGCLLQRITYQPSKPPKMLVRLLRSVLVSDLALHAKSFAGARIGGCVFHMLGSAIGFVFPFQLESRSQKYGRNT